MESKKFSLNKEDAIKIVRGSLYAGAGAAAFYILDALKATDFNVYTPLATALLGVLSNAVYKFFKG